MRKDEKELNGKKVLSAIENIDSDLIMEAQPEKDASPRIIRKDPSVKRNLYYIGIGAAACTLIAGGIGAGVFFGNSFRNGTEPDLAKIEGSLMDGSGKAVESTESTSTESDSMLAVIEITPDPDHTSEAVPESSSFTDVRESGEAPEGEAFVSVPSSPSASINAETGLEGIIIDKKSSESGSYAVDPIPDGPAYEIPVYEAPEPGGPAPEPGSPAHDGSEAPEKPDLTDKFGILTAGRWNDNSNWGFFKNLVSTGAITFPAYGLDPVFRSAVTVKNNDGTALSGLKVEAVYSDNSSHICFGTTNDEGIAYLFLPSSESRTWQVRVYGTDDAIVYTGSDPYALPGAPEEGTPDNQQRGGKYPEAIELSIDTDARSFNETQVMFLLDTTGSMGDELTYLQADFGKIMDRVENPSVSYSWNFYRDEGDDYVTLTNGFSTDREELKKLLNEQYAAGGGDTPEAVDAILTQTMNSSEWKTDSKKIAFLIFDAPPHGEKKAEVAAAVEKAEEKGIHIVPIVSSNSERETELFGRALAIMTDGEYVFLTDDSGVGDSHLEPIIGDYEVQKLGDIIVDIINEYAAGSKPGPIEE